jgi:hypothetical protein
MGLTQAELDQITSIVNNAMNANNTALLGQVNSMVQQQQVAPPPTPAPAAYPTAPPQYPAPPAMVQQCDPMQIAQTVAGILQQNQYQNGYGNMGFMNQYGGLTMNDLMNQPAPVRDAWLQVMAQPTMDPTYQALNQKIDDLSSQLQWQQWKDSRSHSKRHTALKIGAAAVGVGAVAYGVHKFKHRHDKDKSIDAITNLGNRYLDYKFGNDV